MISRYFAYGTNLDAKNMIGLCPDCTLIGPGRLVGWKVGFNTIGIATIRCQNSSFVLGAVWSVSKECRKALDAYERLDIALYKRVAIKVELAGGLEECFTYIASDAGPPKVRRPDHEARLLEGAKQLGLPQSYVESILKDNKDLPIAE